MQVTSPIRSKEEWEIMLDQIEKGYVPLGGKRKTYESGMYLMGKLRDLDVWRDVTSILDIGCGNGRLAIPLVGHDIDYYGIDIIPESIAFCRKAFAEWPEFKFFEYGIKNDFYNPNGSQFPQHFPLFLSSESVDCVLMASVLTHIGDGVSCVRYLEESYRVLKAGGKLYVTWFRSPPNDIELHCERTCFSEAFIINAINAFQVEQTWGGLTNTYHDQWAMVLRKEG